LKSLLHLNGRYEPDTIGRLGAGLADGLPIKSACLIAGIGVFTLADWREKYPELEERMAEAREVAAKDAPADQASGSNNARSAPIKKGHLYPPFLSTNQKNGKIQQHKR
jgi:hypothetical protein